MWKDTCPVPDAGWSGALIDYRNSGDTGGPKNPETKVEVYEAEVFSE
jgi:hypothetical protein